jgi:formylglycine-generating enzyme required for sulfatase activity
MKEPKENHQGTKPGRKWNRSAEEKYRQFQDSVMANSEMGKGDRFTLYCSFHGHDLTVVTANGSVVERPVIDGMGMGFSNPELRRMKEFYDRVKCEYYSQPPKLYFGNLPEDSVYYIDDGQCSFFYTALGARTYGSLRRDFLTHGLHFETPNTMRIPPQVREKTADLLAALFMFVRDSLLVGRYALVHRESDNPRPVERGGRIRIPAGAFSMGCNSNLAWDTEKPMHAVFLDEFTIDKCEVTNSHYGQYLNESYRKKSIAVVEGVVYDTTMSHRLYTTKQKNPFAEIEFCGNEFTVDGSRGEFPVVYVTYWGAEHYARSIGGRIPTEAEWEKAACWNDSTKTRSLYAVTSDTLEPSHANYEQSGDGYDNNIIATTPIGYYPVSSFYGLKDMSGNVWEWTSDNYIDGIYAERKTSKVRNPKVETESTMKSIKGGAWDTEYLVLRNSMRLGMKPDQGLMNLGFRCVYAAPQNQE